MAGGSHHLADHHIQRSQPRLQILHLHQSPGNRLQADVEGSAIRTWHRRSGFAHSAQSQRNLGGLRQSCSIYPKSSGSLGACACPPDRMQQHQQV